MGSTKLPELHARPFIRAVRGDDSVDGHLSQTRWLPAWTGGHRLYRSGVGDRLRGLLAEQFDPDPGGNRSDSRIQRLASDRDLVGNKSECRSRRVAGISAQSGASKSARLVLVIDPVR